MKNTVRFGRLLLCGITLISLVTLVAVAHAAPPQISAGQNFSLFLRPDGSLWTWGYNYWGQLGIGTTNPSPSPIQIGTDTNWTSAGAGYWHAVGVKSDGSLWAWGANWYGQVGDNTIVDKHSPVRIGADNDWASVVAGMDHNLALKLNGSLWAWGKNGDGQLGNSTNTDSPFPFRSGPTRTGLSLRQVTTIPPQSNQMGLYGRGDPTSSVIWEMAQQPHGTIP